MAKSLYDKKHENKTPGTPKKIHRFFYASTLAYNMFYFVPSS